MSEYTTRQILDMIEANGGPEGLDLSGKDLRRIDLSRERVQVELEKVREEDAGAKPLWIEEITGGVNLAGSNLREANLGHACLQCADLCGACLEKADLAGASLQYAFLRRGNLRQADLTSADLRGANLKLADLQGAKLWGSHLEEVDLRFVISLDGAFFYRAHLSHTEMDRAHLGSAVGEEVSKQYEYARDAYLRFKRNFEELGDYSAARWAYLRERRMIKASRAPWRARRFYGKEQLRDAFDHRLPARDPRVWCFYVRHTVKWLGDWLVEALCGYGESICRVLGWMAVLLFGSPLLFGLLGLLDWPDRNVEVFFGLSGPCRYAYAYLQQFLYVLDAFTTANFAELRPANDLARALSGFIALLGIFLTGLLGFVAGNRIRRS